MPTGIVPCGGKIRVRNGRREPPRRRMRVMRNWLQELRKRFGPFRTDADLGAELQVHLDELTEDGLSAGLPFEEARRRARLRLGDSQAVAERVRDGEISVMLESWYR